MTTAIVLAMHGAPPMDYPKEELTEFFKLHVQKEAVPENVRKNIEPRYNELELKIRTWPRTESNDPFFAGASEMAQQLNMISGCDVIIGFNEFCSPTLEEAIALAGENKPDKIVVITPMMTRGGEHAGLDIPRKIKVAQAQNPDIPIVYAWPFEVSAVAKFLFSQVKRFELM
jgi:sirohydrochlorin cobaltochelatase